jgi:Bacterial TSP3 repeat
LSEGTLTFLGGTTTISSNLTLGDCGAGTFGYLFLKDGNLFITNAAHNATLDVRNDTVLITGGHLIVDRVVMTNDCGLFIHAGGTVSVGSELLDPNLDADNDGLPNGWEIAHGLDPLDSTSVNGADGDPDGDGYSNMQEYLAGSDPQNPFSTPVNPGGASFAFTSLVRSGDDIVLTWSTTGGTTNQVQVSPGSVGGSYSTNGFVNLGAQIILPGSGAVITNFTDTNGATNKPARYYRIRFVP